MQADVTVSFYLSGCNDSDLTSPIGTNISKEKINTYFITFGESSFNESEYHN